MVGAAGLHDRSFPVLDRQRFHTIVNLPCNILEAINAQIDPDIATGLEYRLLSIGSRFES